MCDDPIVVLQAWKVTQKDQLYKGENWLYLLRHMMKGSRVSMEVKRGTA